jgi:hypothetical protein
VLVINSGTDRPLREAVKNLPEDILRTFGGNPVAFGGMVRRLAYIHDVPVVGGLQIPLCKRPHYAGGQVDKAIAYLHTQPPTTDSAPAASSTGSGSRTTHATSIEDVERFRFFAGCCLWDREELQRDVESGYWIPVLSEPDTVLTLALPGRNSSSSDLSGGLSSDSVRDSTIDSHRASSRVPIDAYGDDSGLPENDVWQFLLRGLGPPFATMADLPQWINSSTVDPADWK